MHPLAAAGTPEALGAWAYFALFAAAAAGYMAVPMTGTPM